MGLNRSFGGQREKIWHDLAERVGGSFVDEPGTAFDRVVVEVEPWTVTLDIHRYPGYRMVEYFTRMRAPYVNPDGFQFVIHRRNLFEQVKAKLGLHNLLDGVETGFEEIDRDYVVRSNDPKQVKRLLANPRLRELILAQPQFHMQVRPDDGEFGPRFPDGVDELYFEVPGEIRDLERLKGLYDLFAETLHTLCHIGAAYESDPHMTL